MDYDEGMTSPESPARAPWRGLCWTVLAACIARLWLVPMRSSFWVDELVTVFVVRHPGDPSFAPVPQVPASIYYWLPRVSSGLFGNSEFAWRIPSALAMALALFLIGRIAARLIHPRAGWFAIFACLGLHGINYFAADARPYGAGIAVASLSVWLLIRWLDNGRWQYALGFALAAALLWRIHLIYWPFYLVFGIYTAVRIARKETNVGWWQALAWFGLLSASLVPVAINALFVMHQAGSHVIAEMPGFREFEHAVRWSLVLIAGAGVWLMARILKWPAGETKPQFTSIALIALWWLGQPLAIFLFSRFTGDSAFITRYVSLALPGTALMATAVAARWIPEDRWLPLSLAMGAGAVLFMGQWTTADVRHDNSDWRAAAREVVRLADSPEMPVICLSPFVEARSPVWTPDYPLPGFLYSHLGYYPLRGRFYLFPFGEAAADGETYAAKITAETLGKSRRFVIYGANQFWRDWFAQRPELSGWRNRLEMFGDVKLVVFEGPAT